MEQVYKFNPAFINASSSSLLIREKSPGLLTPRVTERPPTIAHGLAFRYTEEVFGEPRDGKFGPNGRLPRKLFFPICGPSFLFELGAYPAKAYNHWWFCL